MSSIILINFLRLNIVSCQASFVCILARICFIYISTFIYLSYFRFWAKPEYPNPKPIYFSHLHSLACSSPCMHVMHFWQHAFTLTHTRPFSPPPTSPTCMNTIHKHSNLFLSCHLLHLICINPCPVPFPMHACHAILLWRGSPLQEGQRLDTLKMYWC